MVALVASALGVPRSAVEVIAGVASRRKTLRVFGATRARVQALG